MRVVFVEHDSLADAGEPHRRHAAVPEHVVALLDLLGVGEQDRRAQPARHRDQRQHMRLALGLVRVEQGRVRGDPDDGRELPDEVLDVTDAGLHALTQVRRHRVCRVAREQDEAHPPGLGHRGLEVVDGAKDDRPVPGGQAPWADEVAAVLLLDELLAVLVVECGELEACVSAPAPAAHHLGPRRVEHLGRVRQVRYLDIGVAVREVDDQVRLGVEAEILLRRADRRSREAVRAVGTDEASRLDGRGRVSSADDTAHLPGALLG